tara:strand:+ start:2428 stop:2772 length:345 start_codon:yes stop_codon:yes gene_type:complete
MPEYVYEHPETGEKVSVIQGINEDHVYECDGVSYNRVFLSPNARIDSLSEINADSSQDFVNKTKGKNMTLGELWDTSAELSQKREDKSGKDKVKSKYFEQHSQKRRGLKHMKDK